MVDLRINLLEKQQTSLVVTMWRRRLYLLLTIISTILLFDGIAVLFVRTVLLARSRELQTRYGQIVSTIEEKKENEGLYLTLVSRLELIDSVEKQSSQLDLLPEAIYDLLSRSMVVESFSIDQERELELNLQTDNPDAIELMLDKLAAYKTEDYSFSNIVVESTEVDEEGNYSIQLRLSLDKQGKGA